MKVSEKLAVLFPTPESILSVKQNYPTWEAMAKAVGISKNSIYSHRKALGMEVAEGNAGKLGRKTHEYLTDDEIKLRVKEMFESKNVVTKYRITDMEKFERNPCGNDGIELIGTEQGDAWSYKHNPDVRR